MPSPTQMRGREERAVAADGDDEICARRHARAWPAAEDDLGAELLERALDLVDVASCSSCDCLRRPTRRIAVAEETRDERIVHLETNLRYVVRLTTTATAGSSLFRHRAQARLAWSR